LLVIFTLTFPAAAFEIAGRKPIVPLTEHEIVPVGNDAADPLLAERTTTPRMTAFDTITIRRMLRMDTPWSLLRDALRPIRLLEAYCVLVGATRRGG
jgi:hypothetical protein